MTPTPDEARTLDAALARIVPADDAPGGRVARDFVLGRLTLQPDHYRSALALLGARGFANLTPEAQDAVLADLEGHPSVALMVQHTLEGYYTSEAGFALVGFRVTA